jgi:hypothetical protein
MAAGNTSPIFTAIGVIGKVNLAGNIGIVASDGIGTVGTAHFLLATGGAQGTYVSRIRIHAYATAAAQATGATVLRFYISTKAAGATAATDTFVFQEVGIGALSASNATVALTPIDIPCGFVLPVGITILVSSHANMAANTGFQVTLFGGDY